MNDLVHRPPLRCLAFDLGNVLVWIDNARKVASMARACGLSDVATEDLLTRDQWQWRYERGELTTAVFAGRFLAAATKSCDEADVLAGFCDMFVLNEPMQPLLATLRRQGLRLILVSNTNEAHISYVQRHWNVLAPFDGLVLSHEIKAMKPEPGYYAKALEVAGVPAAQSLFIDDLAANIEGAAAAGFRVHQYAHQAAFVEDLRRHGIQL